MESVRLMILKLVPLMALIVALVLVACSSAPAAPQVIEKEVIKEVIKEVVKEVPVEVPVDRVVEKVVIREVLIQPKATPEPIKMDLSKVGWLMKASESNIKRGGVVRTAGPVEMAHWDLHQGAPAYTGITNIYNNLTYRNVGDGQRDIVPDLATSWEVSNDGLAYIFTLREGVKWHDGVEFTALDVLGTFNRILDPPEGVITGSIRQSFEPIEEVRLLDTYKIAFDLKRPTPWFINVLGAAPHFGYPVIYPKHFLDANDQNVRENLPPGTGPFVFKERIPGEFIELEANIDYWNPDLPYVDGIKAIHIPVWANRGAAVLTGIVDFTWNGNQETWNLAMEQPDKFHGSNPPINGTAPLWTNNSRAPFDDVRVRRAINLGLDKKFDLEVAGAIALPQYKARWITRAVPGHMTDEEILTLPGWREDEAGRKADIAEAKRLMAEAGYPDGFHIKAVGNNTPAGGEVRGVAWLQQAEDILGITSDLEIIERGLEGEILVGGEWDVAFLTGTGSDVADPTAQWNGIFRCGADGNYYKYCNPEFDILLDNLLVEFDAAERVKLLRQAMDMLDENPPGYMVAGSSGLPMGGIHVKGLRLEDLGGYPWGRYETVWLDY
jgi:peptide/nickel transport system substrate-binding protein